MTNKELIHDMREKYAYNDEEVLHKAFVELGRRGGLSTLRRYGREHFVELSNRSHEIQRENAELLAKYQEYFKQHPRVYEMIDRSV